MTVYCIIPHFMVPLYVLIHDYILHNVIHVFNIEHFGLP